MKNRSCARNCNRSQLRFKTIVTVPSGHGKAHLLAFEYRNILLPDSHVNEPRSNGYVRFKVRTQAPLTLGQ